MRKKENRRKCIPNKYNDNDVLKWQSKADKKTGGNLTLWIELTLNKACDN